ncbi:hypothetical protein V8E36_004878 [Tilletia maclaganii]
MPTFPAFRSRPTPKEMSTQNTKIEIAIIGSGPVGACMARLLQHKDTSDRFHVTVYEAEAGEHARWQGSSLDLRPNTGLKAIIEAGLLESFMAKARVEGEEMRFCDKDGNILVEHAPFKQGSSQSAVGNPEISRGDLRDVLMDSLRPDTVKWGHKLVKISKSATHSNRHVAHFTNGEQVEADLIIGADGAWSKTRNFLTDIKPAYSGMTFAYNAIKTPRSVVPELMELVGEGICFFLSGDGQVGATLQLACHDELAFSISVKTSEAFFKPGGQLGPEVVADPASVRHVVRTLLQDFTPTLTSAVDHLTGKFWSGGYYSMPADVDWVSQAGVTLIGDAMHATTPHVGEGANTGMVDALDLANAILAFPPPLRPRRTLPSSSSTHSTRTNAPPSHARTSSSSSAWARCTRCLGTRTLRMRWVLRGSCWMASCVRSRWRGTRPRPRPRQPRRCSLVVVRRRNRSRCRTWARL